MKFTSCSELLAQSEKNEGGWLLEPKSSLQRGGSGQPLFLSHSRAPVSPLGQGFQAGPGTCHLLGLETAASEPVALSLPLVCVAFSSVVPGLLGASAVFFFLTRKF